MKKVNKVHFQEPAHFLQPSNPNNLKLEGSQISYFEDEEVVQSEKKTDLSTGEREDKEVYDEYLGSLQEEVAEFKKTSVSHEVLRQHRIRILEDTDPHSNHLIKNGSIYIRAKGHKHYGTEVTFDFIIAKFHLEIKMLNLHRLSEKEVSSGIGFGSFGIVKQVEVQGQKMAIKKIMFDSTLPKTSSPPSPIGTTTRSALTSKQSSGSMPSTRSAPCSKSARRSSSAMATTWSASMTASNSRWSSASPSPEGTATLARSKI